MCIFNRFLLISCLFFTSHAYAEQWLFKVFLNDSPIGSHRFMLERGKLTSRADFNVKLLFINAYQYQHQSDEVWEGDCLRSLKAHTVENKVTTDVQASMQENQLLVSKNGITQTLGSCVMTFAYWNPAMLKQKQLLNPQNADYLDIETTDQGLQPLNVKNVTVSAHQYRLQGTLAGKTLLNITLWYDQNQRWIGLKSVTPEGYKITYKLVDSI